MDAILCLTEFHGSCPKIQGIRSDDGKRDAFMTFETLLMDARWEGREEGYAEGYMEGYAEGYIIGIEEGKHEVIRKLLQNGMREEEIERFCCVPREMILRAKAAVS